MEDEQAFNKILFLTDGSDPSRSALELTIYLAKKLESNVTVFHVVTHELMGPRFQNFLVQGRAVPESADIEPGVVVAAEESWEKEVPTSPGAHYSERIEHELTSVYRQEGEDIVADAAQILKEEGVAVDRKLVERKSVAEAVMEENEREFYDLMIMGRNGQKAKELHLGSVAEKVSRQSEIPVLIAGERRTISKILVPLDGSKSSEKALTYAATMAKKLNAKLTLLHVQEPRLFGLRPQLTETIGKNILSDAAQKLKGVNFNQKLESGHPAKTIAGVVEKEDFDIIVMGSKGHSSGGRFFLGGVIDHVLHYTKHTVLIVK